MTLYLLILTAFLTHIGFAGSRLAVPLFAVDQGGGPFVAGTIVALYAALPVFLALPMGRMADRIGYRPLTQGIATGDRHAPVAHRIRTPRRQAAIALARNPRRGGIDLVEIG